MVTIIINIVMPMWMSYYLSETSVKRIIVFFEHRLIKKILY